jgi:hypothetical protein
LAAAPIPPARQLHPEAPAGGAQVEMVTANGGTSTPEAATSLREALHPGMGRTESGTLLQRATSTATSRARRHKRAKPLSLLPLVALCFYDVSGGPFGIEVGCCHIGMHAVPMPDDHAADKGASGAVVNGNSGAVTPTSKPAG